MSSPISYEVYSSTCGADFCTSIGEHIHLFIRGLGCICLQINGMRQLRDDMIGLIEIFESTRNIRSDQRDGKMERLFLARKAAGL